MKLSIFRFNPERDKKPYMQDYEIDLENRPDAPGRHSAHQGAG